MMYQSFIVFTVPEKCRGNRYGYHNYNIVVLNVSRIQTVFSPITLKHMFFVLFKHALFTIVISRRNTSYCTLNNYLYTCFIILTL